MCLTFNVVELTNEARNMHGLRHQDYERYRQFCTRKVHRIRKRLDLSQGKKKFQVVRVTSAATQGHLEILLFQVERAWSYAMQLKRESAEEPRKKHHLIKRLRKSADISAELESLCAPEGVVDTRTRLDVQAYAALMAAYLVFEQQKWQEALDKFGESRTIYEKMAKAAPSAHQEALCYAAIDSIDPNIRYCAYNLRIKGGGAQDINTLLEMRKSGGAAAGLDLLASKVDSLLAKSRQDRINTSTEFSWRSHTFSVKNEKLINSIFTFQEEVKNIESQSRPVDYMKNEGDVSIVDTEKANARLEMYNNCLGLMWDASKMAESDLKNDVIATAKVKSSKSEENTAKLRLIHGFIAYSRLSCTIDRNIVLLDMAKSKLLDRNAKPPKKLLTGCRFEDVIKLHDIIIQSLMEMRDIPVLESDVVILEMILAKIFLYKAYRAYYVAQAYSDVGSHQEAFSLYGRATQHLISAKQQVASLGGSRKTSRISADDAEELKTIESNLQQAEAVLKRGSIGEKAKLYLKKTSSTTAATTDALSKRPTLYHTMSTFHPSFDASEPNLIKFPVSVMPIPTKPFFFDIASNGIELPLANIERRAAGKTRLPIERPVHRDEEKVATSAAATTVAPAESKSAGGGIVNWLWGK